MKAINQELKEFEKIVIEVVEDVSLIEEAIKKSDIEKVFNFLYLGNKNIIIYLGIIQKYI